MTAAKQRTFSNVKLQILATFAANTIVFGHGCNIGWFSPSLPILVSEQTPLLEGPLSADQVGWIGSAPSLGAMLGGVIYGYIANKYGYRNAIMCTFLPITISWMLIIFAQNALYICAARFIIGISGGGTYLCIPGYVAEIADDYIRGQLNSYIQVYFYSGVLAGYIGGTYLEYDTNPMVMATIPIIFVCFFMFMPSSPQHLLRINKIEDAEKSLQFYRNSSNATKERRQQVREEFEKFQAIAKQNEESPRLQWSDFCTKSSIRAFAVVPVLLLTLQLGGSYIMSNFAATIFQRSGSTIDANLSSICMGALQVIGTYTASNLMDRVGRKKLMIISTSGASISHLITGTYVYLGAKGYDVSAFNALPICSISFFIFINAIGILNVPYVVMGELMPAKIRKMGSFICTMLSFTAQFNLLKLFPILLDEIELHGWIFFFGCVTTFGLLFTVFMLKETKGKNLDVLEAKV